MQNESSRTTLNTVDILGMAEASSTITVNGQNAYRKGAYFQSTVSVDNSAGDVYANVTVSGAGKTSQGKVYLPSGYWEAGGSDYDGNTLNIGRWNLTWDGDHRLVKVESQANAPVESKQRIEMEYDWQGRRIKKVVMVPSGTWWRPVTTRKYLYDGWRCVAELDENNQVVQSYLWGLDLSGTEAGAGGVGGLLAVKPGHGIARFVAMDGNGNVAGLVEGSGGMAPSAQYEYGPFGEPIRVTGALGKTNPFRWSTKHTDDETDLVYYGYRFYNPSTGRWLNRDPIEEKGGLNLYGFLRNNPTGAIDPLGMRIFIISPDVGSLDYTGFDEEVLNGFQRIIGDCAKLQKSPIIREVQTGFLLWKKGEMRLIGWELYYTDEKRNCLCDPCWKYLKAALGPSLNGRDIHIHRGARRDNAFEVNGRVLINEDLDIQLPELDTNGSVVWNQVPFEVVLWHEAIGHGYCGLTHPNVPSNKKGEGGQDPVIVEENNARNCLRLQGIAINDRVPTYYGWK